MLREVLASDSDEYGTESENNEINTDFLTIDENRKHWILFFPVFFMVRRVLFTVSVVFFQQYTILQIAFQFSGAITMVIYLGHHWPFEEPFSTKMEVLNEVTNLFLMYHMMTFTDWVDDPKMRYNFGYSVILFVCLNICIHSWFLIKESIRNIKIGLKKRAYEKNLKKTKGIKEQERKVERQKKRKQLFEEREREMIDQHEQRKREAGFTSTVAEVGDAPTMTMLASDQARIKTFIRSTKNLTASDPSKELDAISDVEDDTNLQSTQRKQVVNQNQNENEKSNNVLYQPAEPVDQNAQAFRNLVQQANQNHDNPKDYFMNIMDQIDSAADKMHQEEQNNIALSNKVTTNVKLALNKRLKDNVQAVHFLTTQIDTQNQDNTLRKKKTQVEQQKIDAQALKEMTLQSAQNPFTGQTARQDDGEEKL